MTSERSSLILSALLISLGLAAAGFFIGQGISGRNSGQRTISVKGLSEKEVPASVATWTVDYSATGNDLAEINKKLADSTKAVLAFLKGAGFEETDMAVQPPSIHDTSMDVRDKDSPPPPERYRSNQSVLLRTAKVDAIKPALASASNLMMSGVLLSGKAQPNYIFNELNDIKPGMIQEATKNAHSAEQFSRFNDHRQVAQRLAGWSRWRNPRRSHPNATDRSVVGDVSTKE